MLHNYYIPEASNQNFKDNMWMVHPQKMVIFGVLSILYQQFYLR
eukprot:UN22593